MANDLFQPGSQPAAQFPLGPDLMAAALANPGFRARISAFQKAFLAWPELIQAGQFIYSRTYLKRLREDFTAKAVSVLGAGSPALSGALAGLEAAITSADLFVETQGQTNDLDKDVTPLSLFDLDGLQRSAMEFPLGPDLVRAFFPVAQVVQSFFSTFDGQVRADIAKVVASKIVPYQPAFSQINIFHYMIAKSIEIAFCFDTVRAVANKFQTHSPPSGPLFGARSPIPRTKLGTLTELYSTLGKPNPSWTDFLRQQSPTLVRYRPKSKAQCDTVNRLSDFLDQGGVVRAGVISGKTYSYPITQWARPEHYLLLLASLPFPSFGAVAYLFWDPDNGDTFIHNNGAGEDMPVNYGVLFAFYEPSADKTVELLVFSTGFSREDLMSLDPAEDDFHGQFKRRHRYQVLTLWDPVLDRPRTSPIRTPK